MNANRTLLWLAPYLLSTSSLGGQALPRVELPDTVYGFARVDTTLLEGTAGTAYRYKGPGQVLADVFVYSVPQERLSASDSAQLSAEVTVYVAGLAAGVGSGRYDAYEIPVNTQIAVETNKEQIPCRAVVMVFRRGDESFVSFMHLFLRALSYVKVRLTLPAPEWSTSTAPNFALELAEALFQ